jgi:hypothetical protein
VAVLAVAAEAAAVMAVVAEAAAMAARAAVQATRRAGEAVVVGEKDAVEAAAATAAVAEWMEPPGPMEGTAARDRYHKLRTCIDDSC